MDYRLNIEVIHADDDEPDYVPHIEPASAGLEGVFYDWGELPEALQKIRVDAQSVPYGKLQWVGDAALIRFDESDVLKVYDNFALIDGLNPEPSLITRENFVVLIDQWLRETGGQQTLRKSQ